MPQPSRRRRTALALVGALLAALATGPPAGAAPAPEYAGYLFTYFTGENTATGEQVGSKSIVIWESADLVNYYDEGLGRYVVFWASKLYSASDPNHTGATYNRTMYATTSDFRTFSPAQVWVDKGYSTIDSTLIKHNGTYYRFTKDERSPSQAACGKLVLAEKSATVLNRSYSFVADCLGRTRSAKARARWSSNRTPTSAGTCSSTSTAAGATSRSRPPT